MSFFLPLLVSLVLFKFLVKWLISLSRLHILVVHYWMEAPLLPTVINILEDVPYQCPIVNVSLWMFW